MAFERSLGWLSDLIAQHLYRDSVPRPMRRRWDFIGDGWDLVDDPVNGVASFAIDPTGLGTVEASQDTLVLRNVDGATELTGIIGDTFIRYSADGERIYTEIVSKVTITDADTVNVLAYSAEDNTIYRIHVVMDVANNDNPRGGTIEMVASFERVADAITQYGETIINLQSHEGESALLGGFAIGIGGDDDKILIQLTTPDGDSRSVVCTTVVYEKAIA